MMEEEQQKGEQRYADVSSELENSVVLKLEIIIICNLNIQKRFGYCYKNLGALELDMLIVL